MNLVSEKIEQYCESHSSGPSEHCEAIARFTYENVPVPQMLTGSMVAGFLGLLIDSIGAKKVLEIGCFTGYSALAMAEHVPPGGEVVTIDVNPETMEIAKRFWVESPHGKKIRPLLGDAHQLLGTLKSGFDFIFIDANKPAYAEYGKRALELLNPNGLMVADNCLWTGRVADPSVNDPETIGIRKFNDWVHNHPDLESTLIPMRDGLHVVRRKTKV